MKRTPLARRTPLKAKSQLKAKPARKPSGDKVTFVSVCQKYELPTYLYKTGPKGLRWPKPLEKGISWEIIKKIVRLREKDCYTCGATDLETQNAQAGHCYPVGQTGSNNSVSWDLRLIHLQCSRCNGAGQGEQGLYEERIRREYGEDFLLEARSRRYRTDAIKDWNGKLAELWAEYQLLAEQERLPAREQGASLF